MLACLTGSNPFKLAQSFKFKHKLIGIGLKGTAAVGIGAVGMICVIIFIENLVTLNIIGGAAVKVYAYLNRLILATVLTQSNISVAPIQTVVAHIGIGPNRNNSVG